MKWFGIDYRYVIAGVGAVLILGYEYFDTAPQEEIENDNRTEAQNSKAQSIQTLNEKLLTALSNNSSVLLGAKPSVEGPDEKSSINVRLDFPNLSGSSFTDDEKKFFKTLLLGLTCSETPSYYDHNIENVNYEFSDGQGTKFDSAKVQLKACLNFNKALSDQHINRDLWPAAGSVIRTQPASAKALLSSGYAIQPIIESEEGYSVTPLGVSDEGVIRYQIKHEQELASNFDVEAKKRMANAGLNGVCLNSQFRDLFKDGFSSVEIEHLDKEDKILGKIFVSEENCKNGRPDEILR